MKKKDVKKTMNKLSNIHRLTNKEIILFKLKSKKNKKAKTARIAASHVVT